jgi:lipopolysaccharide heptosyltransferase I
MSSGQKILIVRLSAVGDCVHAIPAVMALRQARPDAHIAWAVDDRTAPLLEGLAEVDQFVVLPRRSLKGLSRLARWKKLREFRRELKARHFDTTVDFQGLAKSAFLAYCSGAHRRLGLDRLSGAREMSWLFYTDKICPGPEAKHVSEKSAALLEPLGLPSSSPLPLPVIPLHEESVEKVLLGLEKIKISTKPYAILNPGAGWVTKLWPVEHYGQLARMIRETFKIEVLVSWFGPAEKEMCQAICATSGAHSAPDTNLPELAELLRGAVLYVGSDTGPTHIAAATGTPTVGIFGAADSQRNAPLGPNVRVLNAALECSPCWQRNKCPRAVECMSRVTPEEVMDSLKGMQMEFAD